MITPEQRWKRERDLCEHPLFAECDRGATTIVTQWPKAARHRLRPNEQPPPSWRCCDEHAELFKDPDVYEKRPLRPRVRQ